MAETKTIAANGCDGVMPINALHVRHRIPKRLTFLPQFGQSFFRRLPILVQPVHSQLNPSRVNGWHEITVQTVRDTQPNSRRL